MLLSGAVYFQQNEMLAIAVVLLIKAVGFLGVAALSTPDLLLRSAARV
jgi:hypothetical protein